MKLDNLAVVFIGTDKYLKFLPSWYQTCEEKLVPNILVHVGIYVEITAWYCN